MAGLLVLGLLSVYIGLFYYLARHAPNRSMKVAAIGIGLAIPFWDLPIGYVHYRTLCHQEGGLHTLAKVPASESIFLEPGAGYAPENLAKIGFKRIEYGIRNSPEILVFTMTEKGIERSRETKAYSKLSINTVTNQPVGWNLFRRDVLLSERDKQVVLARHTEFFWNGLWWQDTLFPNSGSVSHCHARGDNQIWNVAVRGAP